MTPEEEDAERELLSLMTRDTHKFAIAVDFQLTQAQQHALERLQLRDWIRLIDVSVISVSYGKIVRVFRVMPEAVRWYWEDQ